jgi:GT2 family glycosyltransferase
VAALRAGLPALRCEWPEITGGAVTATTGDLSIKGWAVSRAGIEEVTVDVETRGTFPARIGLRRPDVRRLFYPLSQRKPGFEVGIPTEGWSPGIYSIALRAHDAAGNLCSQTGRLSWAPSYDQLAEDLQAGRPALWLGEPYFDPEQPCGDFVSFRGWVRARAGIDHVEVHMRGTEKVTAFHGFPVHAADVAFSATAPPASAFAAVLDVRSLEPGNYPFEVIAVSRNEQVSRRSGLVAIDAGARYRRWLAGRARGLTGQTADTPSERRARLHVCVCGDGSAFAFQRSLDRQLLPPAAVERSGDEGLEASLRSFLDDRDAAALVVVQDSVELEARALACIDARLKEAPETDLVYADHDALDASGQRSDPFVKPGWSPELLLSLDYIGPLVAIGRDAARTVLDAAPGSISSPYGVALSFVDAAVRAERIPEILCTRTQPEAAATPEVGDDFLLEEVARRRGRRVDTGPRDPSAVRQLRWELDTRPLVTVVIPTTGAEQLLSPCLRSLRDNTSYEAVEVVLVDSGGLAEEVASSTFNGVEHRTIDYRLDGQFNFSRACNLGVEASRGEFILFLNDDTEALAGDWLERMLSQAQHPAVGVVGAKLLFPEGLVQHAGLALDALPSGFGRHFVTAMFGFLQQGSSGYQSLATVPRDCSAVTGACLMISRTLLEEVGGWDEGFRIDFGDVDLCLAVREMGHRVIVEPRATLIHREHATQGFTSHDEDDARRFLARWHDRYSNGDPWYHPLCRFARDWELE